MTGSAAGDMQLANEQLYKERELLRNMLCGLCTRLERRSLTDVSWLPDMINEDEVLKVWWENHQREDQRRDAQQMADKKRDDLAKAAREKLTREEREALGIRD
jgi:phage gp46-like protein